MKVLFKGKGWDEERLEWKIGGELNAAGKKEIEKNEREGTYVVITLPVPFPPAIDCPVYEAMNEDVEFTPSPPLPLPVPLTAAAGTFSTRMLTTACCDIRTSTMFVM